METTDYIPHSLIRLIYPDIVEPNTSHPYGILVVELHDNKEYTTKGAVTTDANGISGTFTLT